MKDKLLKNKYVKNFYDILKIPSIRILPGTIAYYLILAIVPVITLIAFFCTKFSLSTVDLEHFFSHILPRGVSDILLSIFTGTDSSKISLWFVVFGFFLASNGADAIILSSNILYNTENKSYFPRRVKAFFLTFVLMSLFLFILVVLAFGNIILKFVLDLEMFANISTIVYRIFLVLKWPLAIIIIYFLIKVLYTMAPDKKVPSKYVTRGALFTTVGLILSTAIYSYYVNNIADYSYIYGNLANIIALMILIYVISYILVLGVALNANIYNVEIEEKKEE